MPEPLDLLQQILEQPSRSSAMMKALVNQAQDNLGQSPLGDVRLQSLIRLGNALQLFDSNREERVGTSDLVVLLRQVIRTFSQSLRLHRDFYQQLQNRASQAGLYATSDQDSDSEVVYAPPWQPNWLQDQSFDSIDELVDRRQHQPVIGDGLISAVTGSAHKTYRSIGQKRAVDACLFAPAGATLLVTLPTGGGKSMCVTLPAWHASQGGTRYGGTSLVVVPTISLAIDQQRQSRQYFRDAVSVSHRPHCLTSGTENETRAAIYRGLADGSLPILYTSPEALLNGKLYEKVLEAARRGQLNWLVVDEAHVAESWGAGFRTEFQLLATFRRKLLAASGWKLRTLLLSATISAECQETLIQLFSEKDNLITVLANQLRPEIAYWFAHARDEESRKARILDALFHLPRPAILYVIQPAQAQEWVRFLHQEGFYRLAAYSGATAMVERESIQREWNRDQLDLIVATSAFGLGVDKANVRAVLHASLPESVDRFYQEVGRGGRDGYTAVSLICTTPKDADLATGMTIRSRITTEKAFLRWQAMWQNSGPYGGSVNQRIVDLDAAPSYNPEMSRNETHRNWNEHVLLLMQRARIITIEDTKPLEEESTRGTDGLSDQPSRRWLRVKVQNTLAADSPMEFHRTFEPFRNEEVGRILSSLRQMSRLARNYADARAREYCLALEFADIYPGTSRACGGCPHCRQSGHAPYSEPTSIKSECRPQSAELEESLHQRVSEADFIRYHRQLNAIWDGLHIPRQGSLDLLVTLASVGFQQFILPEYLAADRGWVEQLVTALSSAAPQKHRLLVDWWVSKSGGRTWPLHDCSIVVVYPDEPVSADALYRRVRRSIVTAHVVNIVRQDLWLDSEHGSFIDRVDGLQMSLDRMCAKLENLRDTLG
jgi:ATP-dependent DNA helicase RecQ